jgi:hypothetical protein
MVSYTMAAHTRLERGRWGRVHGLPGERLEPRREAARRPAVRGMWVHTSTREQRCET